MKKALSLEASSEIEVLQALRVLIAEDEPTQRMMLKRTLERAGYEVEAVSDGAQALARLREQEFAMLVTDWDMPGLDGGSLCREVRCASIAHYVYIVILTSHDLADDLVAGLDAGADDYVRKSANPNELVARLAAGARIVRLERSMRAARARIEVLLVTDPLLPLYNRRFLNDQLEKEVARAHRHHRQLSVVIADIDHFKRVNDVYGHLAGDEVLQAFTELLKSQLRVSDWAARYGGEEFVVILPETDVAGAYALAEDIRERCALEPLLTSVGAIPVTSSFGVASLGALDTGPGAEGASSERLLRAADAALYRSKEGGRNRVEVAGPESCPERAV
jgi:diguanylate cyclase (GGDEF)-like protein